MPHPLVPLLLSAAVLVPGLVSAAAPAATASTSVLAASALSLADRSQVFDQAFGMHSALSSGAAASVNLGADADGVPFIAFSASASGRNFADLTGQLTYYWRVEGAATGNELVPVTITTLGHFNVQVTADALNPNLRASASANWLGVSLSNTFETWSTGGRQNVQTYGINAGNRSGPKAVGFIDPPPSAPGGIVTASGAASFAETFTVMVFPNATNRIVMQVGGGVSNGLYNSADPVYSWTMSGYLDPVIAIDAAYASRFSVVQSDIPMVPVPEVSTWVMLLAGLGAVAALVRRRRAAGCTPCRSCGLSVMGSELSFHLSDRAGSGGPVLLRVPRQA